MSLKLRGYQSHILDSLRKGFAAGVLSLDDLSKIETPRIPTEDERQAWLRHLSYCQFNFTEMSNGYAWRILNS